MRPVIGSATPPSKAAAKAGSAAPRRIRVKRSERSAPSRGDQAALEHDGPGLELLHLTRRHVGAAAAGEVGRVGPVATSAAVAGSAAQLCAGWSVVPLVTRWWAASTVPPRSG